MAQENLTDLTDEELLQKAQKMKSAKIFDAFVVGLLFGVATFSLVKNGFSLLLLLPFIYIPIAGKNAIKRKELQELLKERNLTL
ncbi:MAG: FUSC family protein [Bacteroidota bacterium]